MMVFRPSADTFLIKLCNARFTRERQAYLFTIWRLKYQLKNETKFRLMGDHPMDNAASIYREQEREQEQDNLRSTKKIAFDFADSNDIGVATSLVDGSMRALKYLRERAGSMVFEVFVRSANNAEQRKS